MGRSVSCTAAHNCCGDYFCCSCCPGFWSPCCWPPCPGFCCCWPGFWSCWPPWFC